MTLMCGSGVNIIRIKEMLVTLWVQRGKEVLSGKRTVKNISYLLPEFTNFVFLIIIKAYFSADLFSEKDNISSKLFILPLCLKIININMKLYNSCKIFNLKLCSSRVNKN